MEAKNSHPVKKIGIIGAGISGLVAAKTLRQEGFDCEIFERKVKLGGVWAIGYHGLQTQTPKVLYEFPDWSMPQSYSLKPTGEQVQSYLESYARHFDIFGLINFNCEVNQLEPKNSGWVLHYLDKNANATQQREFDYIILSSGLYSNPHIPSVPDREKFQGQLLHSSQYSDPKLIQGRKVVVVGLGKSALDIATDAAKQAQEVSLVFRQAHWPVPNRKLLGIIDLMQFYLNRIGGGFLPLYQRPEKWEKILHSFAPGLVWIYWRVIEFLVSILYDLGDSVLLPSIPLEYDLFAGNFEPSLDTYPLLRQGNIKTEVTTITEFTPTGIKLANGKELEADVVFFGTGWQRDYSFLPQEFQSTVEKDGPYLYRHIISPILKNIAFIGWVSTFSDLQSAQLQMVWLTHLLKGKISLPAPEQMSKEISQLKEWKRGSMPFTSNRSSMIQSHMLHYHDELLRDLGINPKVKGNWMADMFEPYTSSDYKAIVRGDYSN